MVAGVRTLTPMGPQHRFHHAVNSRAALQRFLESDVHIAEGDIVMGRVLGDSSAWMPIMAHPPKRTSDLPFAAWAEIIKRHQRAIKADVKEASVITEVVRILAELDFPQEALIVNADVLVGPGGGPPSLALDDLLACRAAFPCCTISVGATTGAGGQPYSSTVITALVDAIGRMGPPATVALRVESVLAHSAVVQDLLGAGCHITFWNAPTSLPADQEMVRVLRCLSDQAFIDVRDAEGRSLPPRG